MINRDNEMKKIIQIKHINKLFNFLFSLCVYYKLTLIAFQVDFLSYQKIQWFVYERKFYFGYSKLIINLVDKSTILCLYFSFFFFKFTQNRIVLRNYLE